MAYIIEFLRSASDNDAGAPKKHCRYCKKLINAVNCVAFCNDDCLSDYIIVKIFEAKQAIRER